MATPEEIAKVQESLAKLKEAPAPKPKRARENGKFKPDDPATPDVNEAYDPPKPKPTISVSKSNFVEFVSKEVEIYEFEVMFIMPSRRPDRRLVWKVPAEDVARFEVHHHVQRGRIVRSDAQI